MPKKRPTAEQIIGLLRQAEVEMAQGRTVGEICRGLPGSMNSVFTPTRRKRGVEARLSS